jgi:hypothetical protein
MKNANTTIEDVSSTTKMGRPAININSGKKIRTNVIFLPLRG